MITDLEIVVNSGIRLTGPILFAGLGELVAERAGTLNISVEGMMLAGAFFAALGSSLTGSPILGMCLGLVAGSVVALIQGLASHRLHMNQFVVGLVLNILVLGLTSVLAASVDLDVVEASSWAIPGLSRIPIIGPALFDQSVVFYLLFPIVPLVAWLLYRTRWGLEVRAAGDDAEKAAASGVEIERRRVQAILLCGVLTGFGGACISVGVIGDFTQNLTGGRGFIAIAAVIFGGWKIKGLILGCLIFGFADGLRLSLPAIGVTINSQLLVASPYIIALIAMIIYSNGKDAPRSLGVAYIRR